MKCTTSQRRATSRYGRHAQHAQQSNNDDARWQVSFEMSEYTSDVDGLGTLRLLNAIRTCGLEKTCRFYQASTSELYV